MIAGSITPVFGAPLLLVQGEERVLVAADLHLGLEHELWLGGVSIPSQTEKILASLQGFLDEIKPDRLLLLGDIKHNVPRTSWQEKREVPEFLRRLCEQAIVEIVPGNHDSNLADMAPQGTQVHSSSGFVLDGVGYFHGHTWPNERVLRADCLVTAHLHPAIRLWDPLGRSSSRPVWARARFSSRAVQEHYGFESNSEIIISPAFNGLCGGLPLNEPVEEMRGPLLAMADWQRARLYLLDGTDLGTLEEIKSAQRKIKKGARFIAAVHDDTHKNEGDYL
ncbi:MAG: Calcineurin-like phosphoesterase [Methanosaeta sp. PtaU1.Bin112]|nr:MAG: Calcineurin-like phosphoesterase [Methanosaeta sp. PtaU1.Bin112]